MIESLRLLKVTNQDLKLKQEEVEPVKKEEMITQMRKVFRAQRCLWVNNHKIGHRVNMVAPEEMMIECLWHLHKKLELKSTLSQMRMMNGQLY